MTIPVSIPWWLYVAGYLYSIALPELFLPVIGDRLWFYLAGKKGS